MQRPTWATVVGILGIVFASLGILGSIQQMLMPLAFELQREILSGMKTAIEQEGSLDRLGSLAELFQAVDRLMDVPRWFAIWSLVAGLMSLLATGFQLFASIRLLQLRRYAPQLFYMAAASVTLLKLVGGVVAIVALSFVGLGALVGALFSAVLNLVLILVVATGDKEAFMAAGA